MSFRNRRRWTRTTGLLLVAGFTAAGFALAGCTADVASQPTVSVSVPLSKWRGDVLAAPVALPAGRLTDTSGAVFDWPARTSGKLTLLYFGYTHCPDVCPTTMADIAAGLRGLTPAQRARVQVVFVTTDPQHDSPAAIRQWLDRFDPSIIGLTGTFPQVSAAAGSVGIEVDPPKVLADGTIDSSHGAEVLLYAQDRLARIAYVQATATDYEHDLPMIEDGQVPR